MRVWSLIVSCVIWEIGAFLFLCGRERARTRGGKPELVAASSKHDANCACVYQGVDCIQCP